MPEIPPFSRLVMQTALSRGEQDASMGIAQIKEALKNGANINELNHRGNSPLCTAMDIAGTGLESREAPIGAKKLLQFLVDENAELVRKFEQIPYKPEQITGNTRPWAQDLREGKPSIPSEAFRDPNVTREWLAKGGDPNARSDDGSTPLMRVAATAKFFGEDVAQVNAEILIKNGANVNLQNHSGNTALMMAANAGISTITKILMDNNANPAITNINGETAANIALKAFEKANANELKGQELEQEQHHTSTSEMTFA